ncbi:MAG: hypothetical protein QXK24_06880 [Ignisphaera sp.]
MRKINIIVPSLTFSSFSYVGKIVKALLLSLVDNMFNPNDIVLSTSYLFGSLNVRVDDAFLCVMDGSRWCDIAWVDTALQIPSVSISNPARFYTCSFWDKNKLEKLGIRVYGVVPRPVNPLIYRFKPSEKIYDFYVCGWYREPDRKNFRFVDYVSQRHNVKIVGLTNYSGRFAERYDFGSLRENDKFDLIGKSRFCLFLSGSEGFGMPVLESMSMGVPVVYLDAPAHNEFAVGLKVKADRVERYKYWLGSYLAIVDIAIPDVKSLDDEISYAMGMGRDEYDDLSVRCIEKSREYMGLFLEWLHQTVIGS